MLTTRFVIGSPNWIDLGTPDLEAAHAFYGALFGWEFQSMGPEVGGYGLYQLDGRTVTGAMTVPTDEAAPAWSVYFQTPDTDATAKAVTQAGGSVVFGPMDIFDVGRMAIFADAAGAGFGSWQPGTNKGFDLADDPGSLCWLELITPDAGSAMAFYRAVFDWQAFDVPFPGGTYTTVHPAEGTAESMFGGLVPAASDPVEAGSAPYWLPYFGVSDADAVTAKARELGGEVRMEPTDLEGVGRIAKLTDPWGARFAVLKGVRPPS